MVFLHSLCHDTSHLPPLFPIFLLLSFFSSLLTYILFHYTEAYLVYTSFCSCLILFFPHFTPLLPVPFLLADLDMLPALSSSFTLTSHVSCILLNLLLFLLNLLLLFLLMGDVFEDSYQRSPVYDKLPETFSVFLSS